MNVLILSDLIAYSGVGQYMMQLGYELTNNDDVRNVVLASPKILRNDIPPAIIQEKLEDGFFTSIISLRRIINKYDISVVHCNHRKVAALMNLYQFIYGKIPVVWTCHTVPYPNNCIKQILGYYGHISIAISSEAYEWMHRKLKISEKHLMKITNGVDNAMLVVPNESKVKLKERFFYERFGLRINGNSTNVIVAHGRLDPVKGLNILVEAVAGLSEKERSNLMVVMSGNTECAFYYELIELIKEYELIDNFFFCGWINANEILSFADLMVQPSLREGYLLAALEAFFMKVPVIRTMTGGYQDMRNCCIGIPINDVNALRAQLKEWIKDKSIYDEMVKRAYAYAMEEGTVKAMTDKTLKAYKRAIQICY